MKEFKLQDVLRDEFDDIPQAPADGTPAEVAVGDIEGSMLGDVPKMGDPIPIGTWHFRADGYSKGATAQKDKDGNQRKFDDGSDVPPQPWFMIQWICQQEPHTGRRFGDMVNWIDPTVAAKAQAGDSVARQLIKNRCVAIKAIQDAAGWKPAGKYNLENDFLSKNPEVKIQLGIRPGKAKNPVTGKYDLDSGEMQNRAIKYVPLGRPA